MISERVYQLSCPADTYASLSRPNLPTRNAVPPYNFPTAIPSAEGNTYPPNTHSPTNFASPELPPSQYDEYDTPASPDYEPEVNALFAESYTRCLLQC